MTMLRAAMTQTCNAYTGMPDAIERLPELAGRLDEIRQANVDHHVELLSIAANSGARIICFGELFTGPYFALHRHDIWFDLAEDAREGPTVTTLSAAAAEHNIVVVAPIFEADSHTGRRFNTAVVIDADGAVIGRYRKTHIPVGENEQGTFDEAYYYGPSEVPQNDANPRILGTNPYFPAFQTAAGPIGVAICYDRHFEGVVRSLTNAGARLIFSPAVTFGAKSARMWNVEFAVDAARHRVFIGGSNRLGSEPPWNQHFFGDSHFVGPDGRLPSIDGINDQLIIADVDLASLDGPDPSGWNLSRDQRPTIYG